MPRVLVVDDEPAVCWSLRELLTDRGYQVDTAGSVEAAWDCVRAAPPDVVVLDVRLPGEDGLSALPEFRKQCPGAKVIVITAFGDLPTAAKALGRGAFEYLVKPFDLGRFAEIVDRASQPETTAPSATPEVAASGTLVGSGPAMQAVFRQIALVAPTEFPVLLLGETGTGKEVAARAVHDHSGRSAGPFVATCLAALNPALIESELFGHVRGAFTGAVDDRPGLFELAAKGTLFLDEIAETPPALQVKLLRVLETRRYCPVGSGVERTTTARLVAATHRNLPARIAEGEFREDFYHRLGVFSVTLPPLRDRPEDLRPLVEHFLSQLAADLRPAGISADFWDALARRTWPGNVRALRNAIDHAVVLARREILRPEHLPLEPSPAATGRTPSTRLEAAIVDWTRDQLSRPEPSPLHEALLQTIEPVLLAEVLSATVGNRTAAAKLLGLDRATLRAKLKPGPADRDEDFSSR
jgi:two-component system nitrogen regulation response regulator GlnG